MPDRGHLDELLDQALAGTFPASDPVSTLAWQAALIRDADLRSRLGGIRQPILLIETEGEGAATRACQQQLAAALPTATTEVILTTGQYPYLTHPHRLVKVLREFLLSP